MDPLSIYLHGKNGQPDNPWAYTFLSFFRDDPKEIYQEMQRKRPDDARWVKVEIASPWPSTWPWRCMTGTRCWCCCYRSGTWGNRCRPSTATAIWGATPTCRLPGA